MVVCSMLRVDLQDCATCVCVRCRYTVHVPHPKATRRAQSRVQRSCLLSNCVSSGAQDLGTRNRTVMYTYDVHFAVRT